ncbi:RagB/SusD family nutrient uptake outer membrane protein [Segatella copri]|uniref:RagB/SusD family nutrient uptake outer membrane protein n=1 Tax=Segatella copri TaxID=165179 RepID=UPI0025F1CA3A|nr:RagB/SusD family nutrient uptake outer membrane protein [Segatella copri]MDV3105471.1 RagB/SusD family nutrient uptake outer membrane protein [Segatella copri]MDV3112328.1 RagB/SusD family nutrient uptake outer membrane protein [Segatella copri]
MKLKNILYSMMMGTAVLTGTTSCVSDLDQYPHTETTSKDVYTSLANYEAVLGKIYAAMVTSGQGKGGDNKDMASVLNSGSGFDYMRMFINMQECGTDEFASTWLTGEQTTGLTYLSWDANDAWISDMYYRIYYNIALCNEFLRNANSASFSGADAEKLKEYKAEVRFMRALFYYHALDFFRNIPMVTENDPVGSFIPPRYTPQQTFDYIESELKDCVGDMLPASTCPYGQASQGAAYTLLAKLYLNSEVYTGVAKYAECKEACEKVMDMGYSLESDYSKLFNADNDKRTNEIIFALPVSAEHTVSWGASTYLVCGQLSMSNANQNVADFGATSGWSEFRLRPEFVDKFTQADIDGDDNGDKRCKFFTNGQSKDITDMTTETAGYLSEKWSNLKDDGTTASNTGDAGVDTDFPLFRLADVYLMYAECVVRTGDDWDNWAGGSDAESDSRKKGAIYWINKVRERAYGIDENGNPKGQVWKENFSSKDAFLQFILDERARELYHEGYRRTDLIRYGQFTTNKYIWQWKGGVHDGQAVDSKYNIYPIPNTELTANPNLHNDNY